MDRAWIKGRVQRNLRVKWSMKGCVGRLQIGSDVHPVTERN